MRTEDDFETVKGLIQQASLIFEIIKKKKALFVFARFVGSIKEAGYLRSFDLSPRAHKMLLKEIHVLNFDRAKPLYFAGVGMFLFPFSKRTGKNQSFHVF